MYWKSKIEIINGAEIITYSYFTLVHKPTTSNTFFNSGTQSIQYPVRQELSIESDQFDSEEQFLSWYSKHKTL